MRKAIQGSVAGLVLLLLLTGRWALDTHAGEGLPELPPERMMIHGGVLKAVKDFHVETAFRSDGIDVYVYDKRGTPLSLGAVGGVVHVDFLDPTRPEIDSTLTAGPRDAAEPPIEVIPEAESKGTPPTPGEMKTSLQDRLSARMDLTRLAEAEAAATLKLQGLPGGDLELEVGFRMARVVTFTCPVDGMTRGTPGDCDECGVPLLLVRSYYGCRKHPTVALDREGNCWKDHDERLDLIVEPAITLPGGSTMEGNGMGRAHHREPPTADLRQR